MYSYFVLIFAISFVAILVLSISFVALDAIESAATVVKSIKCVVFCEPKPSKESKISRVLAKF